MSEIRNRIDTAPALTPEEWSYFTSGGVRKHVVADAVYAAEAQRPHDLTPHGLAALALHGRSFGFTHYDVTLLRHAAEFAKPAHPELLGLADRIAALLPPQP